MATYKTPDVYVEEISVFPPSVAEVETAIPAFIGYTERAGRIVAGDLHMIPTRISSMLDFDRYYGGAPKPASVIVDIDAGNNFLKAKVSFNKYLYDSIRLHYMNGGGDCYIVSVGDYSSDVAYGTATTGLFGGLSALEMYDEPTLILFPDAVAMSDNDFKNLQQEALKQCNKLMDRFAVLDLKEADTLNNGAAGPGATFRAGIGINYLKYGAAYTPWLKIAFAKNVRYADLKNSVVQAGSQLTLKNISGLPTELVDKLTGYDKLVADMALMKTDMNTLFGTNKTFRQKFDELALLATNAATLNDLFELLYNTAKEVDGWGPTYTAMQTAVKDSVTASLKAYMLSAVTMENTVEADTAIGGSGYAVANPGAAAYTLTEWGATFSSTATQSDLFAGTDPDGTKIAKTVAALRVLSDKFASAFSGLVGAINTLEANEEASLIESFPIYKTIINGLNETITNIPPSGAMVGVYAATDRDRGVWKAPANVSLAGVVGPTSNYTASQLDNLNIDANGGKSINAIRSFAGKGTLVWGSRTLAGNDNEWRYVPVRRFFNSAEESIKKSTYWAVFEPNNANTWIKVRGMIENYLTNKWKEGALTGAKPDEAFFVRIGLGTTMTAQEILEGYMKVEIGMAVVRPAEFIVLKFSHKLQVS
ncbi:MAG: phage tail sheath C-terminal domain-containing protein [Bacteroidia bacterium]